MNQLGQNKKRRGVGSIIAGAFIVLILMSGFTLYQFNNKSESEYQKIITTMNEEDTSKSQEKLNIISYEPYFEYPNTLKLVIKVVNNGPETIVLKYGAILLQGEIITDETYGEYTKIIDEETGSESITLPPSGESFITIQRTREVSEPLERYDDYVIHLVSEKGNIFPLRENAIPAILINDVMSSVAEVVGEFLPKYTSFTWGSLKKGELQDPPNWVPNFVVHKNQIDDGYIFSITGRWYGTEPITLSSKTVLKFESIDGPSTELMCYIVHYDAQKAESYIGNEVELEAFDLEQELPNLVTLFFAADEPGGDPSKTNENFDKNNFKAGDSWQIKLGIFDVNEEYAQTYPLQVLQVEN